MRKLLCGIATIAGCVAGSATADQPGFVRIPLQTQDVCVPGSKVAVQVRGEFDPGFTTGRHTHPGEELTYILEGEIELRVDGQPPRIVKAGETLYLPAGVVHEGVNSGNVRTKVLATYIVEKGQPVATPVK
jgi:quercetin dioxygenase-like cupin family protein